MPEDDIRCKDAQSSHREPEGESGEDSNAECCSRRDFSDQMSSRD